jgi:hypothetical protein
MDIYENHAYINRSLQGLKQRSQYGLVYESLLAINKNPYIIIFILKMN